MSVQSIYAPLPKRGTSYTNLTLNTGPILTTTLPENAVLYVPTCSLVVGEARSFKSQNNGFLPLSPLSLSQGPSLSSPLLVMVFVMEAIYHEGKGLLPRQGKREKLFCAINPAWEGRG